MVGPCIVKDCLNIGNHRFPRNESRKIKWIRAIKHIRLGLIIRPHSLICSVHFQPTDFCDTPIYWTNLRQAAPFKLKKSAVPSIFPWSQTSAGCQKIMSVKELSSILQQRTFSLREHAEPQIQAPLFHPTFVRRTYSRGPPIRFVEESPYMDTTSVKTEDPLHTIDDPYMDTTSVKTEDPLHTIDDPYMDTTSVKTEDPLHTIDDPYMDTTIVKIEDPLECIDVPYMDTTSVKIEDPFETADETEKTLLEGVKLNTTIIKVEMNVSNDNKEHLKNVINDQKKAFVLNNQYKD